MLSYFEAWEKIHELESYMVRGIKNLRRPKCETVRCELLSEMAGYGREMYEAADSLQVLPFVPDDVADIKGGALALQLASLVELDREQEPEEEGRRIAGFLPNIISCN